MCWKSAGGTGSIRRRIEPEREKAALLFDQLQRVHELAGPEYQAAGWTAAAMMQDVGKFMNHQGHHRHTQYIVANSEMFGFSPQQRAIVSGDCTVYWARAGRTRWTA